MQAHVDHMWSRILVELRHRCATPCVLAAYCSTAKPRAPTTMLGQLNLDPQKFLSQSANAEGAGPRWATVERSPEAGARMRRRNEVVNSHIEGVEMGAVTAHIFFKGLQLVRLAKAGPELKLGQHKQAIDEDMWERLHAAARSTV